MVEFVSFLIEVVSGGLIKMLVLDISSMFTKSFLSNLSHSPMYCIGYILHPMQYKGFLSLQVNFWLISTL